MQQEEEAAVLLVLMVTLVAPEGEVAQLHLEAVEPEAPTLRDKGILVEMVLRVEDKAAAAAAAQITAALTARVILSVVVEEMVVATSPNSVATQV
jgi:hypothetical protein